MSFDRGYSRDVNKAFDEIVFSEARHRRDGFTRGFSLGEESGWREGYQLGLQRGAQLASEIGFYQGFVHAWIIMLEREESVKQKRLIALRSLLEMTEAFPRNNMHNEDAFEKLQVIRTKFKQVASLLNVNPEFGETHRNVDNIQPEMSF